MLSILYEDDDILVAVKPPGLESQASRSFEPDMVSEIRKHINKLSTNPSTGGKPPYVGVVHRLDKPVGGVMVYAKNQKAAASLSRQVQERSLQKTYQAVCCGKLVDNQGVYVDYLWKNGKENVSRIVDKSVDGAKRGELSYRVLAEKETDGETVSLVEIDLKTGRHHQIRVQMAGHGTPLWGDAKYGNKVLGRKLALWAVTLRFCHPVLGRQMEFSSRPEGAAFRQFLPGA